MGSNMKLFLQYNLPKLFLLLLLMLTVSTAVAETKTLRLYTTTTVRDSGLAAKLIPAFEKQSGIFVEAHATGTGKALKAGRLGKADILFVHAPDSEKQFIKAGYGTQRITVMYNDFIIVGPPNDPAGIKPTKLVSAALKKINQQQNQFVSRGDDSGTHKKELSLWQSAGIAPFGLWYFEAGAGMKKALLIADQQHAYTLTDRSTWLANKHLFKLEILHEGDPELINTYSVISINPDKHPQTNMSAAKKFIQFVTKGEGRNIIASHKVAGEFLFKFNPW